MLRVALRAPVAEGMNVTVMMHVAAGRTGPVQLVERAKSPACGPPIVIVVNVKFPVPVFVTNMTCEVDPPTTTFPNAIEVGFRLIAGVGVNPVP